MRIKERVRMMKNKFRNKNHIENGSALIFALTMLALLLIMLIGFLASTLLEQRAAYAQSDATASQLLAKGALVRVRSQLSSYSDDIAWMRYRSSDAEIIAPIVSIADDGDLDQKTLPKDLSNSDEAYAALKPLLHRYFGGDGDNPTEIKKNWEWRNFFPASVKADYPQWIYYYNNPDKDQIVGRVAYVIVPNFGIDPLQLNKDIANRIGGNYDELSLQYFTTTAGAEKVHKYKNYLSVDFFNAKDNMSSNDLFKLNDIEADYPAGKLGGVDGKAYREFTNLYLTTRQQAHAENDWRGNGRVLFTYDKLQSHAEYVSMLNSANFQPANLRNQVAANICDYMDSDSTPTSDVAADTWLTGTAVPTYTGNEKTPYINQIVPAIQLDADFTGSSTTIPIVNIKFVMQLLTINKTLKFYVELVNIYPEDLQAKSIVLKNLQFNLQFTTTRGSFQSGATTNITQDVTVDLDSATVSQNGYVVAEAEVNVPMPAILLEVGTVNSSTDTTIKVTATVNQLSFDRAVLVDNNDVNVDFVKGMTAANLPYIAGTQAELTFNTTDTEKTITNYANFAVKGDPRCNLEENDWNKSWFKTDTAIANNVLTLGSVNEGVNAANSEMTAEKDIEKASDPAKITAYIRNGVMQSPWELGFIHRGKSFQTINLKSAIKPGTTGANDITYLNDGMLMDRLKFTDAASGYKFNINYPPSRPGIFGLLTDKLKYHPAGKINLHELQETGGNLSDLSEDAAKELADWIAAKCYNAGGSDPYADSAKSYPRYISRAQLVNVITDWALNGDQSPFKGGGNNLPSDAHIEEFIGKIVPLTRCGEAFEYFTAFVVAQSVKDVKGTVYIFDGKGNIDYTKSGLNHGGKVEYDVRNGKLEYYDKITSETFLVARLLRSVAHCEKTDNCYNGNHEKACTFNVQVLESYIVSEP